MLDENLPTFFFRPSSDNPQTSLLHFTHNGSDPAPEYYFRKLDPASSQSKNKYAGALGDAASRDVIFGEVLIEPEFQQPTLSASEIRAQGGAQPPPVPMIPETFTIQLYNPDQQVVVKGEKSTWTGKESWDFELPQQTFRVPSNSTLDREQSDTMVNNLTPKITFRWKRDSKFSKDMTCYMTGKSVAGKKSKDPDITVALYKPSREPTLTVYEPNLQRLEIEDRKGLEVVLLLAAEVIREIYLFPSRDSFNISGAPPTQRKNSRPLAASSATPPKGEPPMMTSAVGNAPPAKTTSPITQQPTPPAEARNQSAIDAETRRLQAMVAQEEREREKRDRAEQKKIKKMLEEEEKEQRRRDAEIAAETERLKKEYGVQGQDYSQNPQLPPRPNAGPSNNALPARGTPQPQVQWQAPQPPPRPVSADPRTHGSGFGRLLHGAGSGNHGPGAPGQHSYGPPQQHLQPQPQPQPQQPPQQQKQGRRRGRSADGAKIHKKKSHLF